MLFGAIWLCTQGENWYGVVLGGAVIMLFGAIWLCTQGENWYGVVLGGGSHHAVWSYLAVYTG